MIFIMKTMVEIDNENLKHFNNAYEDGKYNLENEFELNECAEKYVLYKGIEEVVRVYNSQCMLYEQEKR